MENIEMVFLEIGDFDQLTEAMTEAYPNMPNSCWDEEPLRILISKFPEGQAVIKVNGEFAGCALSIIVDITKFEHRHTYQDITGDSTFSTHTAKGDTLYGIEIFIHPKFRGRRLGRRLYDYRKELCERLNLKGVAFGGRIPNYYKYKETHSPKEYIDKVRRKEIHDPVLDFQLSNDFYASKILKHYLQGDEESDEFAVLLEWRNIYYEKPSKTLAITRHVVRLGLVQWQMRNYSNLDELMQQAEFFIDAVSGYRADFALFPEFFNAPLMAENNHLSEAQAIRELARHSDTIAHMFSSLAISYNINIITGSMPELVNGQLYNAGYVCRRDGTRERFEKLHITPDEAKQWGMQGGHNLKAIDTDCGKIGVLISSDVTYPELGRLLADQDIDILFVPFLTDTQNAYIRVRHCAQSRAIENECYVAIAGCVGNLPKVHNMDIQYAQSAVFTPCDFSFPSNGIKAEATPNTEMILIADVDLVLLNELNQAGIFRNLRNRRKDLYTIENKMKEV